MAKGEKERNGYVRLEGMYHGIILFPHATYHTKLSPTRLKAVVKRHARKNGRKLVELTWVGMTDFNIYFLSAWSSFNPLNPVAILYCYLGFGDMLLLSVTGAVSNPVSCVLCLVKFLVQKDLIFHDFKFGIDWPDMFQEATRVLRVRAKWCTTALRNLGEVLSS